MTTYCYKMWKVLLFTKQEQLKKKTDNSWNLCKLYPHSSDKRGRKVGHNVSFFPSLLNPYCVGGDLHTSSPCTPILVSLSQETTEVEINKVENK